MRIVVHEWERVLQYRDGQFTEVLGPGVHRRRYFRSQHVRVDLRPRLITVGGQEVPTADGLSVKVALLARVRVAEPRVWYEAAADTEALFYAALQVALRDQAATRTVDELLAARATLGTELATAVAGDGAAAGLAVESVAVRDVVVPAELRRAAADVAVARAQGLAALERARSEVAAARALANAAKLVADNPAILRLRTLQAVEAGQATVILDAKG